MALITSNTETIPDINYEYHTLTVDTIGQASANTFTVFLNQPLKNIVQARLLGARINTTTDTKHCYLSINELDTNFSDRTSNVQDGQGSISVVRNSFASLLSNGTGVFHFKDDYTTATQYIDPIRRIDRLSITIRDQNGNTIKNPDQAADNFFILRFVCRKPNM